MRRILRCVFSLLLAVSLTAPACAALPTTDPSTEGGVSATEPSVVPESPESEPPTTESPESEPPESEPPAATMPTPIPVTGVFPTANATGALLPLLPVGSSPEDSKLEKTVLCVTKDKETYSCPVLWDLSGVDFSAAGRKTVPGQLVPGDGYVLAFDGKVTCQLMVTAPGMAAEPLESVVFYPEYACLLPVGGNPESLSAQRAICQTGYFGEYVTCPIAWDFSPLDVTTPGVYFLAGTPILPDGFALPADFVPLSLPVGVVAADCIDLSAVLSSGPEGRVICQWLYSPLDESTVSLEVAMGDAPWVSDPGTEWGGWHYGSYLVAAGQPLLTIFLTSLELHTDYYFRLRYDGDRLSNTLHVRRDSEDYVYTVGGKGGDRDGGDAGGNKLPELDQPAPPPQLEQSPPPEPLPGSDTSAPLPTPPAPVTELVTETTTQMGGLRLRRLAEESDTVLFSKQGVAVELSSDFLLELKLEDDQLLSVTVENPSDNSFRLELLVDGVPQAQLPPTRVRLPYAATDVSLDCVNAGGVVVSPAVYEQESGTVRCIVEASGSYTIEKTAIPAAPLPERPADSALPPSGTPVPDGTSALSVPDVSSPPGQTVPQTPATGESLSPPTRTETLHTVETPPPPTGESALSHAPLLLLTVGGLLACGLGAVLLRKRHG